MTEGLQSSLSEFVSATREHYSKALKTEKKSEGEPLNKVSLSGQAKNEVSILVLDNVKNDKGSISQLV